MIFPEAKSTYKQHFYCTVPNRHVLLPWLVRYSGRELLNLNLGYIMGKYSLFLCQIQNPAAFLGLWAIKHLLCLSVCLSTNPLHVHFIHDGHERNLRVRVGTGLNDPSQCASNLHRLRSGRWYFFASWSNEAVAYIVQLFIEDKLPGNKTTCSGALLYCLLYHLEINKSLKCGVLYDS